MKKHIVMVLAVFLVLSLTACAANNAVTGNSADSTVTQDAGTGAARSENGRTDANPSSSASTNTAVSTGTAIDGSALFTERDLEQTADLQEAEATALQDGETRTVTKAGVYVLSGSVKNAAVIVEAGDEDKVQLVLDGLNVTNDNFPAIYVKNADKVFVTTAADSENSLAVTGSFTADGSTKTDAVIFSRADLVLNGLGTLTISSSDNGISGKDTVKITGGTLTVSAAGHGIEANDGIAVSDGVLTLAAKQDGLHAEKDDDDTVGWIYLGGGVISVSAADDGLHAVSVIRIDGGTLNVAAAEGIEATWIQIHDGEITVQASDDGINAGRKSNAYAVCVEINGGSLTISMGRGDTDAIDSNGSLIITGGTIRITAQSPFDYDGELTHTGGTIIVNGTETTEITNQFGGMGGPGGGRRG